MTPELQAVVERLEETEKQVSHLASLVVAQSDTDRTVEARSFIVRGADGQPRAELSARGEETAFCLFHAEGKLGVEISIREQGPRLVFWDANGKRRATLEVMSEPRGPWLGLFDANENVRACLGTSSGGGRWTDGPDAPEEGPWLEFYDEKQKSVVNVTAGEHGPRIGLFHGNRKRGIDLALSEHGPEIALFDANGEPRVGVNAPKDGPHVFLCNANGKPLLSLHVSPADEARLSIFGKDNEVFWSAPPTSSPDPTRPDSNLKGDSATMLQSWIVRARERAIDWVFLSSLRFFIWLASLAVPFLSLSLVWLAFASALHFFGVVERAPDDSHFVEIMFAGIVISLLLCIGARTRAFDRLFQEK